MYDIVFLSDPLETFPWLVEQCILTVSFFILCHDTAYADSADKPLRRQAADIVILFFTLTSLSLLLSARNGMSYIIFWRACIGIVLAAYLKYSCPYKKQAVLALWLSMYAGLGCIYGLAGQISFLAGHYAGRGMPEAAARILVYLLILPLAWFLQKYSFNKFPEIPFRGLAQIIVGAAAMLLFSAMESFVWDRQGILVGTAWVLVTAYFCLFAAVLFSIFSFYTICTELEEVLLLRTSQQQMERNLELSELWESNMETLRSIRHELKNQYAYLNILSQEHRYEELSQYLKNISGKAMISLSYLDCGNQTLNRILNLKAARLLMEHIQPEFRVAVPPQLPIADDDLGSLLSNMLDNALEECLRLQKQTDQPAEPMQVQLKIGIQNSYLYIVCRNPAGSASLEYWRAGLKTTKTDKAKHGFGTQIMARIAEQYNGCVAYELKSGVFEAKALLDMLSGEEHD